MEKARESPELDAATPNHPITAYIKPQARKPHDTAIPFEEYHYYAQKTREEEAAFESPQTHWKEVVLRKKNKPVQDTHLVTADFDNVDRRVNISDEEWTNASRAMRTAGWGACFFLITTDVLGPYGVGFAMGTLGWGPG